MKNSGDDVMVFSMSEISVIGGGAWGTALAAILASNGESVKIYAREIDAVDAINDFHVNKPFLPGLTLPNSVTATFTLSDVINSRIILITTPAQFFRTQMKTMAEYGVNNESIFVICTKGIENDSLALMSDIFEEHLDNQYAILSGPTFAEEVARGIATSISISSKQIGVVESAKNLLERKALSVHPNTDIIGSQICGAVKNVIAIGCGIVRGLGQGENSKAAVMTRGFNEIMKINKEMGGKVETMMEPCGIGDLVLTCNSEKSRNFSFGIALGQKKTKEELLANRLSVVEGVATSKSVVKLADKLKLNLPLCQAVNDIIEGKATPEQILTLV